VICSCRCSSISRLPHMSCQLNQACTRGLRCGRRCAPRIAALPTLPLLPHLRFLYLQENGLRGLARLNAAPALRLLNLSFNALTGADAALRVLAPAAASLAELDLAGNPLDAEPGCVQGP
jgi:Leucine-rich repeat (LRR) protein